MAQQLAQIKEEINGVAPRYSNVKVAVRGLPIYADALLTGTSRFSRKTGSIGLINPDVEIFLNQILQVNQNQLVVNRVNQWFTVGSYVSVGSLEKFQITAIADDGITFSLNAKVKVAQPLNTSVALYSVPSIAVAPFAQNSKIIQIRSKFPLMIGDKLAFLSLVNLFREIEITNVKDLGMTANPFPYTFELTLTDGIPYALTTDQEVQMRAFPAYFTPIIKVPKSPVSSRELGPFLVDFYGGRINNGPSPEVFFTAQFYDVFSNKIFSNDPISISQNFPIFSRSMAGDTILFWDLMTGTMKLENGNAVAVFDDIGNFGVTYDLQPRIAPGSSWKFNVKTTHPTILRVGFEPNPFTTYNLPAFANVNIEVGTLPANATIEKITIVGSSIAGSEITLGPWILQGDQAERMSFGIMARVDKEAQWLATSIIVKPYFLSLDYLTTSYDSGSAYDSGYINL